MAITDNGVKITRKRRKKRRVKAKEQSVLSIISVRISDEEKERIDTIMRVANIKRYSDVLKIAIQMVQVPDNDETRFSGAYH
jgi:hypothetical protein